MNERTDTSAHRNFAPADIRLVAHQVRYEQMAFWINRAGAIFTVGFSVLFLVLLGASAGNSRISYLGNIRLVQYYVPGFVAYGVMAACFDMLATILVVRRETGLLKRLRLSPLPTWVLLVSIFVSTMIVASKIKPVVGPYSKPRISGAASPTTHWISTAMRLR